MYIQTVRNPPIPLSPSAGTSALVQLDALLTNASPIFKHISKQLSKIYNKSHGIARELPVGLP